MAEQQDTKKQPIFSILAAVFAVLCAMTPILFMTLPILLTVGFGVVSIIRKEKPRWVAPLALAVCVGLWFMAGQQMNAIRNTLASGNEDGDLSAVEITDWSWDIDPSFGTKGTIKWRVAVHNKSDKPIESVRVSFATYDSNQRLLTSTMTYVTAIPPGETRNSESFADYYGTEKSANAAVTAVSYPSTP